MEKNDQRRLFQAAVLTVMFVAAVAGAWAWYHVDPKRFPVSYAFHAVDTIAGYEFKAEPVGDEAVQTLATTNLFNGLFRSNWWASRPSLSSGRPAARRYDLRP